MGKKGRIKIEDGFSIVRQLHRHHPHLSLSQCQTSIDTLIEALTDALTWGEPVSIAGFGRFSLASRPRAPRFSIAPAFTAQLQERTLPDLRFPHIVPAPYVLYLSEALETLDRCHPLENGLMVRPPPSPLRPPPPRRPKKKAPYKSQAFYPRGCRTHHQRALFIEQQARPTEQKARMAETLGHYQRLISLQILHGPPIDRRRRTNPLVIPAHILAAKAARAQRKQHLRAQRLLLTRWRADIRAHGSLRLVPSEGDL